MNTAVSMIQCIMNFSNNEKEAADRAEKYAPKPTGGSLGAGASGAVVGAVTAWGVLSFYGWSAAPNALLIVGAAVVGFVVVFVGYKRLSRKNRRARQDELKNLGDDF